MAEELIEAKIRVGIWLPATAFLPASQAMGSVTYAPTGGASSGGGIGGGSSGGGLAGLTSLTEYITEEGRFTQDVTATSEDKKIKLSIPKDTIGKNRIGSLLAAIRT